MVHIPTKLHQFLTSSFRDFMRTDRQKHTHTQTPPKTIPARSIAGAQWRNYRSRRRRTAGGVRRVKRAIRNSGEKIVAFVNSSTDHLILIQAYPGA